MKFSIDPYAFSKKPQVSTASQEYWTIGMAHPQINVNELSSKMKSKKELYNFLLRDGQAYLPPLGSTNVYFLKQVMRGDKDVSIFRT